MSKVLFTAIVADMRGKLAGTVFAKNKGGNYTRTKTTPTNPQTTFQQAQRAILGNLSSSWRGLTDAQITAWNAAAENFPYTDIFGTQRFLSGAQLYVGLNKNLEAAGQTTITDAPTPQELPSILASAATITAAGTATVTIDPATIPADFVLVVYATDQVPNGISFVKNRFRYLGTFTVTAGVADINTALVARFGTQIAGTAVTIKVAFLSTISGQLTLPSSIRTIVT